ncbi:hypothetical protein COOONC_14133, partial [Cooperia oncophora]
VPDGTSISGPIGLDSLRHPNITIKGDQPGKLEDFQDMIWKSSHQYKNIAEKFDISKEHPGFDVNPSLSELTNIRKWHLGRTGIVTNRWYHWGPRFFDKPLNEAAHEKGLAAAKYTAMLMLPYTMCEIRSTSSVAAADFTPRNFLKRYFQLAPTPTILAFAWGFSLSAAATFRNKVIWMLRLFCNISR